MTEKFQKIKEIVEEELNQEKDSAHDIDHIMRVYNLAMTIAKTENNVDWILYKPEFYFMISAAQKSLATQAGRLTMP